MTFKLLYDRKFFTEEKVYDRIFWQKKLKAETFDRISTEEMFDITTLISFQEMKIKIELLVKTKKIIDLNTMFKSTYVRTIDEMKFDK